MTALQRLQVRQSSIREKLNALLAVEERSDEQTEELETLTTEGMKIEPEIRAAIVAQGEEAEAKETRFTAEDAEGAELRSLSGRVQLGEYMAAAAEGRAVSGAELEFNQALEMKRPNGFPMRLLAPEASEERETTGANGQSTQSPRWIDRVFAISAARYLGVTFESVAPGQASYMTTTAGVSGEQQDRSETTSAAAWTVGVKELKPKRASVRTIHSEEDAFRLPGMEQGLRRDGGMALADHVDAVIFKGDTGPSTASYDIHGLQTLAGTERTITQALKVTGAGAMGAFAGFVDGKHAAMSEDLRIVLSVGANTLWASRLVQSGDSVDKSIASYLKENGLSWMTRADIDTNTANGDFGAYVGLQRGISGASVAAVWSEGQLIRDIYTGAHKGEVSITLSYFWDFAVPRASSFGRVKFVA